VETLSAERGYLKAKIYDPGSDSFTTRITHNAEYEEVCKPLFVFAFRVVINVC
jgi:hypothetical protein